MQKILAHSEGLATIQPQLAFVESSRFSSLSAKQKELRSLEEQLISISTSMPIQDDPVESGQKLLPEEESFSWLSFVVGSIEQMIILMGIYIFSVGPMYWNWLESKQVDGSYFVAVMYEPLWLIAGLLPAFGEWLNWYIRLWIF